MLSHSVGFFMIIWGAWQDMKGPLSILQSFLEFFQNETAVLDGRNKTNIHTCLCSITNKEFDPLQEFLDVSGRDCNTIKKLEQLTQKCK